VLAQVVVEDKSRERAAVMSLLEFLSLKGTIVTPDALNCQCDIARRIVEREGDYALALNGDHRALQADVGLLFKDPTIS